MHRKFSCLLTLQLIAVLALAGCGGAPATPTATPLPTEAPTATLPAATTAPPTAAATLTAAPSTATPLPTEAPTASATPGEALLKFPGVACCRGRMVAAGRYSVPPWLDLPLTVELGEGWRVLNDQAALFFLLGRGENVLNNPSQMIVLANVTGRARPAVLIGAVQRAPELVSLSEPVSVTVAGFAGLQLDSTAKPNPAYEGSAQADIPPGVQFLPVFEEFFAEGFLFITSSPEAQLRTIVLTVQDQTVLLYLEAPPSEFEQFALEAEAVLQSLELIEP